MAILCDNPFAEVTLLENIPPADYTALLTMRYRLESDPDVDASYTPVITTITTMGITVPFFEIDSVLPGIYVLHTYVTSEGPATGTKSTMEVECGDPV